MGSREAERKKKNGRKEQELEPNTERTSNHVVLRSLARSLAGNAAFESNSFADWIVSMAAFPSAHFFSTGTRCVFVSADCADSLCARLLKLCFEFAANESPLSLPNAAPFASISCFNDLTAFHRVVAC